MTARPAKKVKTSQRYRGDAVNEVIKNHVTCPICQEDFNEEVEVTVTSCRHAFCANCLDQWKGYGGRKCPLCNQVLDGSGVLASPMAHHDEEPRFTILGAHDDEEPRFANLSAHDHEEPRFANLSGSV